MLLSAEERDVSVLEVSVLIDVPAEASEVIDDPTAGLASVEVAESTEDPGVGLASAEFVLESASDPEVAALRVTVVVAVR